MKTFLAVIIVLGLLALSPLRGVCQKPVPDGTPQTAQKNLARSEQALKKALKDGKVTRVEIFYLPTSIETFVDVSSEQLTHIYSYKLIIARDVLLGASRPAATLMNALRTTRFQKPAHFHRDFRWGCLIYTDSAKPILAIYVAIQGKNAQIGGEIVGINAPMLTWIKQYTSCFDSLERHDKGF